MDGPLFQLTAVVFTAILLPLSPVYQIRTKDFAPWENFSVTHKYQILERYFICAGKV